MWLAFMIPTEFNDEFRKLARAEAVDVEGVAADEVFE
jgi:hypothetical protein